MMTPEEGRNAIIADGGYIVSEATIRPEDLIPRYMGVLEVLLPEKAQKFKDDPDNAEIFRRLDAGEDLPDYYDDPEEAENVSWFLNEDLTYAMQEAAPEGFTFTSHEGDGACFGFFADQEEEE